MNNKLVAKKSNMWKFDCLKREDIHDLISYIPHKFPINFSTLFVNVHSLFDMNQNMLLVYVN